MKSLLAHIRTLAIGGLVAFQGIGQAATIKVGVLNVESGPLISANEGFINGAKIAVDLFNKSTAGPKMELVYQSYTLTPASAIASATRLVQQEDARFITGTLTSAVALALGPKVAGLGGLVIDGISQADDQTGSRCNANYFRVSTSDSMISNALSDFLDASGVAGTWDVLAIDTVNGHSIAESFNKLLSQKGKGKGRTLFAPPGTADFGSYISQLQGSNADGIQITIQGTDTATFAKQQSQFGLLKKYKTVMSNGFAADSDLPAVGNLVQGILRTASYDPEFANVKNAEFVKAYETTYGKRPFYLNADGFLAITVLGAAVEKAGSTDPKKVQKAMEGIKIDTIVGLVEMRAGDHQLIRPMFIQKLGKTPKGDAAYHTVKQYPAVEIMPPVNTACKL